MAGKPTMYMGGRLKAIDGPPVRMEEVIDPRDDAADLVTYLGSLLPENVNPVHVLLGIGFAFAGVAGGLILFHSLRRGESGGQVNDPYSYDDGMGPPKGVLIVHCCPRGRKTPCIAPYPMKLETFLRVSGINYEIDGAKFDSNGNVIPPDTKSMMILDMEKLPDSQICMKDLSDKFGVDLSSHLSLHEKAIEKAFNHLLEQKIYWGMSLYRWVYDGARSLEKIQYLPESTRESISSVSRTVEHAAWHHGIGKRNPTEVVDDITRDLAALSIQLGTKKYLMSDEKPTELDCTAFAMLTQIFWTMDGPFHTAVAETYTNLADYCWRMRNEFWPDWDECLQTASN